MGKNRKFIILLIALCIIILIGGLSMIKKTVKQERFDIQGVKLISLNADNANVKVTLVDDTDIKITQYSVKKVDETFACDITVDDSGLTITDNAKEVSWLFGIMGSAGISYELQIPKSYVQSLDININTGDVEYSGQDGHAFGGFNVNIGDRGNINMDTLGLVENSQMYTKAGNIDIALSNQMSCMVSGEAVSGDMKIDDKFSTGELTLTVKCNEGNVTVK